MLLTILLAVLLVGAIIAIGVVNYHIMNGDYNVDITLWYADTKEPVERDCNKCVFCNNGKCGIDSYKYHLSNDIECEYYSKKVK